jgi:hypothetical protein
MSGKGTGEHERAVERFWHNYLSILKKVVSLCLPGDGIANT